MDDGQSLCATVPTRQFLSLFNEVKKHGVGAISNRVNFAAFSRKSGNIKAAEMAEKEAQVMRAIATRNGLTL